MLSICTIRCVRIFISQACKRLWAGPGDRTHVLLACPVVNHSGHANRRCTILASGTECETSGLCEGRVVCLFRFVGAGLAAPNAGFKQVISALENGVCGPNNCTVETFYRPGVQVTVVGPDGVNGSRSAYAPTPGYGKYP